ncbi:MAG: xanthine dehydrogenase [Dehalococcoidia bacterium]|nr:MAG: xanthine dehydrogenase [Dehalococcoidia bacterium]
MQNDIYAELVRLSAAGEEAALATVISASGSTPREEGAKMLVRANGSIMGTVGGGAVEKAVIKEALEVMRKGKAKKLEYRLNAGGELGMICGGDTEVFIEPITAAPSLFVFGGGHIAVPLVKMAAIAGFKITVIDERPDFASVERFPDAAGVLVLDIPSAYARLNVDKCSYIVIVTHGHKGDEAALEGALKTPARYIGMIGSKEKNKAVFSHLLARGFTQDNLTRAHAPIGIRIRAQTPEEIAVSILAEMIAVKRSAD